LNAVVVALRGQDMPANVQVAAATQLLGGLGRACAALAVACGDAGYLMTGEPEIYGEGMETIAI
jgi:hypothetical protein